MDDEFMEYGQGLVNLPDGWMLETETGNKIDPEGNVYATNGEKIWSRDLIDPDDEEYDR